jgi:outer membrane protein OmpA-like peptidoglycan-associated protein
MPLRRHGGAQTPQAGANSAAAPCAGLPRSRAAPTLGPEASPNGRREQEQAMHRMIGAMLGAGALVAGCATHEPLSERTLHFGFDRETLTEEALTELAYLQKDAARQGAGSVTIIGHADSVGEADYNQGLSLRRAETVRQDLIARGVPANDIAIVALGDTAPAVEAATGTPVPENRFVTVQIADLGVREAPNRDAPYAVSLPPELPVERRPLDAAAPAEAMD